MFLLQHGIVRPAREARRVKRYELEKHVRVRFKDEGVWVGSVIMDGGPTVHDMSPNFFEKWNELQLFLSRVSS